MSNSLSTDEYLPVEVKHDIYPFIDPSQQYENQAFKGKVVLITGASRGIGQETAVQFSRAGASVVLVGRDEAALEETKSAILKFKADAKTLLFTADVTDVARAEEVVGAAIAEFGRLDVLVANAGFARRFDEPFIAKDPAGWWNVIEINLRGVYNYAHFAIPHLKKTNGTLIAVSSNASLFRFPHTSDYGVAKHALNRFVEFILIENPEISAFSIHPGMIGTKGAKATGFEIPSGLEDTLALPAATFLFLASGRASYLSGRYVSVNWDLEQVEKDWKDKIVSQNGLITKLSIPAQNQPRK